jgi:hypothetical protein
MFRKGTRVDVRFDGDSWHCGYEVIAAVVFLGNVLEYKIVHTLFGDAANVKGDDLRLAADSW